MPVNPLAHILAFDIEASNLSADFGIILCVGFKQVGNGRAIVENILDYVGSDHNLIRGERKLLRVVSKRMLDSDIWLSHFGIYYDLPFINTRLLYHKLPVLPANFPHIDTWKVAKNRLKLHSNRLINLSEFLVTREEKNAIKPEQWIRALGGHGPSMNYIVEHCRRDVSVLEEVYLRIRSLALQHPHIGGETHTCPVCGKGPLTKQKRFHRTRTRKYQRFHCQACGSWSKDSTPERMGTINSEG